jgi:uncharacterized DUF497 family protein
MINFSWDDRKNEANKKKHGVSIDEAKTVFYNENAIRYFDPEHSADEDRFLMVGVSQKLRILIVCHYFVKEDSVIRIISARKVGKSEEDVYWRERT